MSKEKKQAFRKFMQSKRAEYKEFYLEAKRKAKKEVAVAKREAYKELYEKLNTREGEKMVYKIAKQRERASKDITKIRSIKDEKGVVLTHQDDIDSRWQSYFCGLLNVEDATAAMTPCPGNEVMVDDIC